MKSLKDFIFEASAPFVSGNYVNATGPDGTKFTGEIIQYFSSSNRASVKDVETGKKYLISGTDMVKTTKPRKTKVVSPEEKIKKANDAKAKRILAQIKELQKLENELRIEMENDPDVIASARMGGDGSECESVKELNKVSDKIWKLNQKLTDLGY